MHKLWMILGMILFLCGAFSVWMAYAFATMGSHGRNEAPKPSNVLHTMTSDGASFVGFGILLIVAGIWLAYSKPQPPDKPNSKP